MTTGATGLVRARDPVRQRPGSAALGGVSAAALDMERRRLPRQRGGVVQWSSSIGDIAPQIVAGTAPRVFWKTPT